jgi:hypothetical protein
VAFVLGLVGGGLLSALALGLLSGLFTPLPATGRHAAILAVALLGLLREAGVVRLRLPQHTWQVPQDVLQRNLLRGAWQFGVELGSGVRTYISATAPYVLAVAVLLGGQPLVVAALAGAGFGAGRAATPLLRRASGAPADWDTRLLSRLRALALASAAAILAAFAVLFFG